VQSGQHVHVARLLAVNSRGHDLVDAAAEDRRLASFLRGAAGASPEAWGAWRRIGTDVDPSVGDCLARLLARRDALLAERRERRQACPPQVEAERAAVECRLLLLYAAFVRRLCQQAESLPYLNDRPYSLALWLLFGPDIFRAVVARAEFDVEYLCERVAEGSPCGRC
jgi:hypothetical protein